MHWFDRWYYAHRLVVHPGVRGRYRNWYYPDPRGEPRLGTRTMHLREVCK